MPRSIEIDGPIFEQEGEWGHLLNEHYLNAIDDYLYPGAEPYRREEDPFPPGPGALETSRLHEYFHGKSPEPLWAQASASVTMTWIIAAAPSS